MLLWDIVQASAIIFLSAACPVSSKGVKPLLLGSEFTACIKYRQAPCPVAQEASLEEIIASPSPSELRLPLIILPFPFRPEREVNYRA